MLRDFIKRYAPTPAQVRATRGLGPLQSRLSEPMLWHLNRRSVTVALALGLFVAFIPLPGQMVIVAFAAIWLRCNLPVALASVWITNPITIPAIFFGCYQLGSWLLETPVAASEVGTDLDWSGEQLAGIWKPFLLGSLVAGLVASAVGSIAINVLWRIHIVTRWRERRAKRRAAKLQGRFDSLARPDRPSPPD